MSILKSLAFRAFDLAIISMLVSGLDNWVQFAVFVCWVFAVVAFLGSLTIHKSPLESLPGKTWLALAVGWAFHLLYTAALVYSGHPVLAGIYLLGFSMIRARVSSLRKVAANAAP